MNANDHSFCPVCGGHVSPPEDGRWTVCPRCRCLIRRSWKEPDTGFYRLDILLRPPFLTRSRSAKSEHPRENDMLFLGKSL